VSLSLRQKIVGGFGLLLVLLAVLGWVTLSVLASLREVQARVYEDALPGLRAADEIVRSYTAQSAAARGFLITADSRSLAQYRLEVGNAHQWQNEASRYARSRRERQVLDRLVRIGGNYQALVEETVIPLVQEGRRALAFSQLGGRGDRLIRDVESLGRQLRTAQGRTVRASARELRARSSQVVATVVVVLVGALGAGIALAFVLPRRLVADLSRLVEAARAIGRGDLDQRVDIRSGDEIEELAVRFGEMQSGLKRLQQLALQDRELEIAASIQQNLLQRTLPDTPGARLVPHQRQANLVGGDWYDVELVGGELVVVVGDASGKGIAAALMATVALSVLRAERGLGAGSRRVIERANDALREATDPDSFTTLLYASLDLATGQTRMLNMGHPAPFLLRSGPLDAPSGHFVEGARNRALGWFEDPGLSESVVQLVPGDRLVLYTDGWLEAKSPEGETYGDNRLAESLVRLAPLPSELVGEELVREVEKFAAGKLDDDLTMLIVEFQGAPLREGVSPRLTGEEPWHSRR